MTKSDEKKEIYSFSKSDFLTKISFTLNQICDAKKSQLNTSVFYLMQLAKQEAIRQNCNFFEFDQHATSYSTNLRV